MYTCCRIHQSMRVMPNVAGVWSCGNNTLKHMKQQQQPCVNGTNLLFVTHAALSCGMLTGPPQKECTSQAWRICHSLASKRMTTLS